MTKVAERTITDDLEHLITQSVDASKADYAGGARGGVTRERRQEGRGWRPPACRLAGWLAGWLGPSTAPSPTHDCPHRSPVPTATPSSHHATTQSPPLPPSLPSPPAVITGVQIHNWSNNFEDDSPNLEFVAPTSVYVVVGGEKTHLDLSAMPVSAHPHLAPPACARPTPMRGRRAARGPGGRAAAAGPAWRSKEPASLAGRACTPPHRFACSHLLIRLLPPPRLPRLQPVTPRQMRAIAGPADVINQGGQTLLREEAAPYAFDSKDARRRKRERLLRYISLMREEGLEAEAELLEASMQSRLGLQAKIARGQPGRIEGDTSVVIDQKAAAGGAREGMGRGDCAGWSRGGAANATRPKDCRGRRAGFHPAAPCCAALCFPAAAASVRELQEIRQLLEEKHRQQQVVKEQQEEQKKAYAAAAAAQQVQQRQAPAPPQAGPK